jgi:hypothetical protein
MALDENNISVMGNKKTDKKLSDIYDVLVYFSSSNSKHFVESINCQEYKAQVNSIH